LSVASWLLLPPTPALPRKRGRAGVGGSACLRLLLLPLLAGEGWEGGARRRRTGGRAAIGLPPPQPVRPGAARLAFGWPARPFGASRPSSPPAGGGGSGTGAAPACAFCSFPCLRGKAGMGARAAGAREVARRSACPHPNPSGQAQRAWRSDGLHGSA